MPSYNRVIIAGNITRDIELRSVSSGLSVTELGVAINEKRKDTSGNTVNDTVFVDVTLWGKSAELAKDYLGKGQPVMIEGRLRYEQWEQNGQARSKLKVIGERVIFLSSKDNDGGGSGYSKSSYSKTNSTKQYEKAPQGYTAEGIDDDIPF